MNWRHATTLAAFCTAAVMLSGCTDSGTTTPKGNSESSAAGGLVKLQGSGASFPAPLYQKWFQEFSAQNKSVQIDYQSTGSGAGVKAVIEGTVDFGASDAAMTPEEIGQVSRGVQLLPMTAGSVVLAYNLEGVKDLKLSREAYAGIFLGKITKWNDPAIAKANEGVTLPDAAINVVVRSDSSGTTYVFTQHLSAISTEFAASPGTNKKPNWPAGTGAKGNEGVTAAITTTPGAIGYIEYGYAVQTKLAMAVLENKAGKFVPANLETEQAALASIEMPEDLIAWGPDPAGDNSYPIVTYTWIMCYKKYDDPAKADMMKKVIEYGLTEGQKSSEALGYVPLPESVVEKVKAAASTIGS